MSSKNEFNLIASAQILKQTPYVLERLLGEITDDMTRSSGDANNWAPYDVIGHLIHADETDWIPRAQIILAQGDDPSFKPFDRTAQFEHSRGRTLNDLLVEFGHLRNASVETLVRWQLTPEQLTLTGIHPDFGVVTLEQLLSTWVVHDLNHIRQIVTYIAAKYDEMVGPWKAYLSILQ